MLESRFMGEPLENSPLDLVQDWKRTHPEAKIVGCYPVYTPVELIHDHRELTSTQLQAHLSQAPSRIRPTERAADRAVAITVQAPQHAPGFLSTRAQLAAKVGECSLHFGCCAQMPCP